MSEKIVVIFLYFRLRFGLIFSMACGFGKASCSAVDHRNIYNSSETDFLFIKCVLVSRARYGSHLLGANS